MLASCAPQVAGGSEKKDFSSEAYLGDRLHADAGLMPECVLQATYGNLKDMMAVLATRNTRVFLILSSHGGITSAAKAAELKEKGSILYDSISKEQYARYKADDPDNHFQTRTNAAGKTSYMHTYSAKGNRVIMGDISVTKHEIKTDLFGPFCKNPRSNLLVLWSSCFSGGMRLHNTPPCQANAYQACRHDSHGRSVLFLTTRCSRAQAFSQAFT